MALDNVNSVLVADFGSVHTRLALIDLVEGQYRLVASARARSTAEPPLGNAAIGLDRAAQTITDLTGRRLLGRGPGEMLLLPETGGHGVDAFLATSSAGRAMRVVLLGLTPEISLASAAKMLAGSYVQVVEVLCPDDVRGEEAQINAILAGEPDVIVIVGGADDGAEALVLDLARKVETALALIRRGTMPTVLFAGNRALRDQVKALFQPYTTVFVAQNVRPALDDERVFPAQIELALAFDEFRSSQPGGFAEIGRYSQVGVVPTAQGAITTLRYLAQTGPAGLGALYVDVGSAHSLLAAAVDGEAQYTLRAGLGVGHRLASALAAIGPELIRRWLPFAIADDALRDFAANKELRPSTIPGTAQELWLEQAFARELVRLLVEDARPGWRRDDGPLLPPFNPIIGAGAALTETQHPGVSALLLLDALQPTGQVQLQLDPHSLIPALGVVAYLQPLMTVQAMDTGGLLDLGSAFCPKGRLRRGRTAMKIRIRQADGRVINRTVRSGEIWLAPVLPGVSAEVSLRLARGLSLEGKRRLKRRVTAGAAGILFDARGRPLALPRPRDRRVHYAEWLAALTGQEEGAPDEALDELAQSPQAQEDPFDAVLS